MPNKQGSSPGPFWVTGARLVPGSVVDGPIRRVPIVMVVLRHLFFNNLTGLSVPEFQRKKAILKTACFY
jgi:hypothetical protein